MADSRTSKFLSSLWVFFFMNHFFMGLHEFASPAFVEQLVGGLEVSDTLLLIAAVSIELPIAMIVLSRILPNRINWIVNVVAAAYSVGLEKVNNPNPDLDNVFFLVAELAGFLTIIVVSIRWRKRQTREATD